MERNYARLPQWAQDELRQLKDANRNLCEKLALADTRDGLPWYNAYVNDPRDSKQMRDMPTIHRAVRFYAGEDGRERRRHFDVRMGDPGMLKYEASPTLLIHASDGCLIEPHSSNVIGVRIRP